MQKPVFPKSFIQLPGLFLLAWALAAGAEETAAAGQEPAPAQAVQTNVEQTTTGQPDADPARTPTAETGIKSVLVNRSAQLFSPNVQFKNPVGTPAYFEEAFQHHCSAARAGDANALYVLGWLYSNGRGVKKDLRLATTLLTKAADAGHARAREILEVMPPVNVPPELPSCLKSDPAATSLASGQSGDDEATLPFFQEDGKIHQLVSRLAPDYGIDVRLAMAIIAVESGFNPRATSPKNAQGLMQLIPDTARRFNVRDAYDPEQNVKGGLAYLQWLMTQFEGNVELVAAAYNSGEKTIEKYRGVPPYPETQNYVQKVLSLYRKTSHPYRDRFGRTIGLTSP